MSESTTEVLERPVEQQQNVLPYTKQIVLVEHGGLFKILNRYEAVKNHLVNIDPTFDRWAEKFGPNDAQIRDISYPGYFHPEFSIEKPEELEPKDLVLVHLTDTFPEDGIIRTTNHFRPEILRHTIHFTLNGPVVEEQQYGVGNWQRKKYAILIPFEKVMDRIEQFSTDDTFIIGDLELPEGSLVIAGNTASLPKDKSKIGKAQLAVENFGKTPWDLRKAIFCSILTKSYCPMVQGSHGWIEWSHYPGFEVLRNFAEKHELNMDSPHSYHWTFDLEGESIALLAAKKKEDPQVLQRVLAEADRFIEKREDIPEKYRDQLKDLAGSYRPKNQ